MVQMNECVKTAFGINLLVPAADVTWVARQAHPPINLAASGRWSVDAWVPGAVRSHAGNVIRRTGDFFDARHGTVRGKANKRCWLAVV